MTYFMKHPQIGVAVIVYILKWVVNYDLVWVVNYDLIYETGLCCLVIVPIPQVKRSENLVDVVATCLNLGFRSGQRETLMPRTRT